MIICGYQGIGKSTLAKNGNGFIDLESGNFFVDGKRHDDWYISYCQIAMHLSQQGYKVFISSHAVVRNHLSQCLGADKVVVLPASDLKDAWIEKLWIRWEETKNEKDYRAYMNAADKYDENIRELYNSRGFFPIVIDSMDYDLRALLESEGIS